MTRLFIAALLCGLTMPASGQPDAQESAWIAQCVAQISETNKSRARVYCACMAEAVDTSASLRQTDLERSYPPLHRDCFKKVGFRALN